MSRSIRVAVLLVAAAGTFTLGGCRGGVTAAPAPADASPGSSDQLGSIESSITAIEKQVDQDGTG